MYYSFDFRELTVDKPGLGCLNLCCCCCFGAGVRLVTQIQILKAEGLERQDVGSGKCLKVLFVTVLSNQSTEFNVRLTVI